MRASLARRVQATRYRQAWRQAPRSSFFMLVSKFAPLAAAQTVLLDPKSIVVGYDRRRGEPRGRGAGNGDCVDCRACVAACPTGIDIRDGLQLECVACAQCVDACDTVMTKFRRPRGLIRYDQGHALSGVASSLRPLRPRLIAYPLLLAALLGALLVFGRSASRPEVILLRGAGAPYQLAGERVQNQVRVKIQNRTPHEAAYRLELLGPPGAELIAPENPLRVAAGAHGTTSVFVLLPVSALTNGSRAVTLSVSDGQSFEAQLPYRILGPTKAGS